MENLASLGSKLQGKLCTVLVVGTLFKIWFSARATSSDTVSIPDCGVLAASRALLKETFLVKLATDTWTLAATFHF